MPQKLRRLLPVIIVLVLLAAAALAWYAWGRGTAAAGPLTASGTVETTEIIISPELAGRVTQVLAEQGDAVTAGEPLIILDGTLLQAQRTQAAAALSTAQAALNTAKAGLETAKLQYEQTLETARLADAPNRTKSWSQTQPAGSDLPGWYFDKDELIAAAQAEVTAAQTALDAANANLQTMLTDPKYAGLIDAETRIADALAAFNAASDALTRAQAAFSNSDLLQSAQDRYDSAKQELADAQQAYNDLLGTDAAADLLKARAEVQAANERWLSALDRLARLHTGADALPVQIAGAVVDQAQAGVDQAQAAVTQAQDSLDLFDAQIAKLTVYAPSAGVVLERNIEPGEVALAGSTALVIGQLDRLTITVYLPEDQYGEVDLQGKVDITADSFPGVTFAGTVTRIADQAEFTPRNVQTESGRRSTVFAVEITIQNPDGRLKPGMSADVKFGD